MAAEDGAEVRGVGQVTVERVVAEDDIGEVAANVRNFQGDDDTAIRGDASLPRAFLFVSVYNSTSVPSLVFPNGCFFMFGFTVAGRGSHTNLKGEI